MKEKFDISINQFGIYEINSHLVHINLCVYFYAYVVELSLISALSRDSVWGEKHVYGSYVWSLLGIEPQGI